MKFPSLVIDSFEAREIQWITVLVSALIFLISGPIFLWADPIGVSICDDPNQPHNAMWQKYCGEVAAPNLPALPKTRWNKTSLSTKRETSTKRGWGPSKTVPTIPRRLFFEQALDKTPNDSSIQQNLQNAKDKIEARNKFKREQNAAPQ